MALPVRLNYAQSCRERWIPYRSSRESTMTVHAEYQVNVELLKTLTKHGEREGATIDAYRQLIDESTDEGVKYLGRLIL